MRDRRRQQRHTREYGAESRRRCQRRGKGSVLLFFFFNSSTVLEIPGSEFLTSSFGEFTQVCLPADAENDSDGVLERDSCHCMGIVLSRFERAF